MRVNLKANNMDIMMYIAKTKKIPLSKVIDFIIENPDEIVIARGKLSDDQNLHDKPEKEE